MTRVWPLLNQEPGSVEFERASQPLRPVRPRPEPPNETDSEPEDTDLRQENNEQAREISREDKGL